MKTATEITLVRSTPGLLAAVVQYLVDGNTAFLVRPADYDDSIIVRIQVMDRICPAHMTRQIARQVDGGTIQIRLGMVQHAGHQVMELPDMLAQISKNLPDGFDPGQVWRTKSANPRDAARLVSRAIGRDLATPRTWSAAQRYLQEGEALVCSLITKDPVLQTPEGREAHASVSVRVDDAQTWRTLQDLLSNSPFELFRYHAVDPDLIRWVSTGESVEVQGLDPNNVLNHNPEDESPPSD